MYMTHNILIWCSVSLDTGLLLCWWKHCPSKEGLTCGSFKLPTKNWLDFQITFKGPMSDKLPCLRPICLHRLETRLKGLFDFRKFVCDFDIDGNVIKCKAGTMTPITKCLDETFKKTGVGQPVTSPDNLSANHWVFNPLTKDFAKTWNLAGSLFARLQLDSWVTTMHLTD